MSHRACLWVMALALALCAGCGEPPGQSGASEPRPAAGSHRRMLAELERIRIESGERHPYFGSGTAEELRQQIEAAGDGAPWQLHLAYGVARLRLGEEELALKHLVRAHELANLPGSTASAAERGQVGFYAGVGHLRLAETQNCCARRVAESCILPIAEAAQHKNKEGSTRAIAYFSDVLSNAPADSYGALAARWLLNLAHMTLGSYPEGVAPEYLIPPAAFDGKGAFPRLRNIARDVGVDRFSLSGGVVADDFDGDGNLDLITSTWDTAGELEFFRNEGDGRFTARGSDAGFTGLYGGLNILQADYDNDGDKDLLVLRGAWLGDAGAHPNSLLRNDGRGRFEDVTFDVGLAGKNHPTQTAGWADYDLDGDLDLYIGNETSGQTPHPCQLFRNRGDGSFEDVAAAAGVENFGYAKAVSWGDFDEDGWIDLYVSNHGGPNRLYRNRGDGTFRDVARELGVEGPKDSFPAWFWDYDNDGHLDLWVSVYSAGIGDLAAYYLGASPQHDLPSLYRGSGGSFEDVATALELTYPSKPMGSNFGDIDGDGFLDFYLGTGDVSYFTLMPNVLFLNREGRRFEDVTMSAGVGHLQKGHGIAFADLDNDGDQEIFAQMGGAYLGDKFADALFLNPGFGGRWINLELEGRSANRSAIGARIRVDVADEAGGGRTIYRHVTSGGSFGAGPLRQLIGLGRAREILRVEVLWPGGDRQTFESVDLDGFYRIGQGEGEVKRVVRRAFALRGAGG